MSEVSTVLAEPILAHMTLADLLLSVTVTIKDADWGIKLIE